MVSGMDRENMPKNNIIVLTIQPPAANNARRFGKQLKMAPEMEESLHLLVETHTNGCIPLIGRLWEVRE